MSASDFDTTEYVEESEVVQQKEIHRVLIVEDNPYDAKLIIHALSRTGLSFADTTVQTAESFAEQIRLNFDLIISDYSLPQFSAPQALELLREMSIVTPTIVISGVMSDEAGVECMRLGAVDYLSKDRLGRLASAAAKALDDQELRKQAAQAQEALEASEQRFRTSVEAMLDPFVILSSIKNDSGEITDFAIEYANEAACASYRLTRDEFLEKRLLAHLTKHSHLELLDAIRSVISTGNAFATELVVAAPSEDGVIEDRIWDLQLSRLDESLVATWRDITERRQIELERDRAMSTLQAMMDASPAPMYLKDYEGRYILANHAFARKSGKRRGEIINHTDKELFPARLANLLHDGDERCLIHQSILEVEETHTEKDGDHTYLSIRFPLSEQTSTTPYAVGAIFVDITQQKKTEKRLRIAHDELELVNGRLKELDRLKDRFIAAVSHELRTPLTSITGYSELLVDSDAGLTPGEQRMIEIINRNGQRLLKLVEDLLTLSRMESDNYRTTFTRLHIKELISSVHDALAPLLTTKGISLQIDVPSIMPQIQGDAIELERVLLNLLNNAIKFSPNNSTVSVAAHSHGDEVIVSVQDEGIGIPKDQQERLFNRFFRASNAVEHSIQGSGLGLVIVKGIVEEHNGWIKIASEPDMGTTVTFGLPVAPD